MTDDRSTGDAIAGEYALGLLGGDELRQARERLATDPQFASDVARWQGRLGQLHAESEEVAPPPQLWERIEHALVGESAANDNARVFHRRLLLWKSIAAGMTAIAASLALLFLFEPPGRMTQAVPPPAERASSPMIAMLGSEGAMKVVASWDPSARRLVLAVPGDMRTDPNHSNELWVIPVGGRPKSLGTMPASRQMHMQLADALASLLQQGATIAISVEPPGGSPTGSPTGPVVASGALTRA